MFTMASPPDFTAYPWMEAALSQYGQRELPGGTRNNPVIVAYLRVVGLHAPDETPWCSAFANWCMSQANIKGSGRANARSWQNWGGRLVASPVYGCVAVFSRPPDPSHGHVAFWVGEDAGNPMLLGGNQGNAVSIKRYPRSRLLSYRWPIGFPTP
jgi:uncharacterized protein (TIGR02594 family)